jgi:hypothetical protein
MNATDQRVLDELDELAISWPTKPPSQDFLAKRLRQITQSLNEQVDTSLLTTSNALVEVLKEKSKVNEQLPIAYNLYFVNSNLKSLQNSKLIDVAGT